MIVTWSYFNKYTRAKISSKRDLNEAIFSSTHYETNKNNNEEIMIEEKINNKDHCNGIKIDNKSNISSTIMEYRKNKINLVNDVHFGLGNYEFSSLSENVRAVLYILSLPENAKQKFKVIPKIFNICIN